MRITLTLDNGPSPDVTPGVLDTLIAHDVKATFFVLGEQAENPDGQRLIARASAEGHAIGNHTFTHALLGDIPLDAALDEVENTQRLIADFVRPNRLFRPTGGGGVINEKVMQRGLFDHLVAEGYSCVLWNCVPRDWEDPVGWVERALEDIQSRAWTVIVLHDLPTGAMDRLGDFIAGAKALGATFTQAFPEDCVATWRGVVVREPLMVEP
jgi:peptidoglycan/xylan/chitin deacetylase (PgdA/CDA1 family)